MSSDGIRARRPPTDGLPPPLSSMWRLCRLGLRYEPALMLVALGLSLLAAVPDALLALLLAWLGQGIVEGDDQLIAVGAGGMAAAAVGTWFLRTVSTRVQRRFRDRVTIALESHVATLQATVTTIAHQERPELLDRLAVLRDQVFVLDHLYMSVFSVLGWFVRLGITITLLVSVHPVLATLAVLALPTVASSFVRPAAERAAEESAAQARRLAGHLFDLATLAAPGKEVRVTGLVRDLAGARRAAWERWYATVAPERWRSARWHTAGWAVFAGGFVALVVWVSGRGGATAADVLLVLAAGSRLSGYIGATVGEIGFLRGIWMDGSQRLAWLEDYAAAAEEATDAAVPDRLDDAVRFEHVDFAYPGTDRLVLADVDLTLPAGAVVAIVGENGAGKTTLVKLLAKLYEPTSGRILVDGVDLARIPTEGWRSRLAGAFQDFVRFEFVAARTIGLGDVDRVDDRDAVLTAVDRGGAGEVVDTLARGLDTQLGPTWPEGVEVSFGQWQRLALARGFMRDEPLVLVLDEPTAALDAETEHALFERYAARARGARGRITILVSHRFSTVRTADLIVVMEGARVVEVGGHDELVAAGGSYAELYRLQASGYR